jgi:hypothetical protein
MKIRTLLSTSVISAGLLLFWTPLVAAQQPPPIDGVTGTVALEGAVEKTYAGANTIVVKTMDGFHHLFHLTDKTVMHGGKAGDEVLRGVGEGSRVVVHYTVDGDQKAAHEIDRVGGDGLKTIDGVITRIDRRAQMISIRLADGSLQTLRLTARAAANVGKEIDESAVGTAKVVIYFDDGTGRPVAHYFKRIS